MTIQPPMTAGALILKISSGVAVVVIAGLLMRLGSQVTTLTEHVIRFDEKFTASQSRSAARDVVLNNHDITLRDHSIRIDRLERAP